MLRFIRHNLQKKFFSDYYHNKFKYSKVERNKFFHNYDKQILSDLLKNKFNSDAYHQKFSANENDLTTFFQQLDEHQLKNTLSEKFSNHQYLNKFQYTESEWANFQKYIRKNKNKKINVYLLPLFISALIFTTLWMMFKNFNHNTRNIHNEILSQKNTLTSNTTNTLSSIHAPSPSSPSMTSQKNHSHIFSLNPPSLNKKTISVKSNASSNKKYSSTHHYTNNSHHTTSHLIPKPTSDHSFTSNNTYDTIRKLSPSDENSNQYPSLNTLFISLPHYSIDDSAYLLPVQNQSLLSRHPVEKNNFISLQLSYNVHLTNNQHTGYAPYAGIMYQHHFDNLPFAIKTGIAYLYIPLKNSSMYVTQTKHYDFSYRTDDIYLMYQSLHYIRLPLYLNYQSTFVNIAAGLNFNFLLTGKGYAQILHNTPETSYIEKDKIYNFSDGLQNYNYSLNIGLSKNITRRISIGMEYETFLSPITTNNYTFNYSLNSIKIFRIGLI